MNGLTWQIAATAAVLLLAASIGLIIATRRRRWAEMPAIVCCGLFLFTCSAAVTMAKPDMARHFRNGHLVMGM